MGDLFLSENELGIASTNGNADDDDDEGANTREDQEQKSFVQQLRGRYHKSQAQFSRLDKFSDVFKLLSAISSLDFIKKENRLHFMESNFMRPKIVEETRKLRKQILYIVKSNTSRENVAVSVSEDCLLYTSRCV